MDEGLASTDSTSSWTEWDIIPTASRDPIGDHHGDYDDEDDPFDANHHTCTSTTTEPESIIYATKQDTSSQHWEDFNFTNEGDTGEKSGTDWATFAVPDKELSSSVVPPKYPPDGDVATPTTSCCHQDLELVKLTFQDCFNLPYDNGSSSHSVTPPLYVTPPSHTITPLSVEKKFLQRLYKSARTFTDTTWSHSIIKDQFLLILMSHEEGIRDYSPNDDGDDINLLEIASFDWSQVNDADNNNDNNDDISFSPDLMQGLLRPSNAYLDSPIELEFDHDKAMLGLSMLSLEDLTLMRDEMASKVAKHSDSLITSLQQRDVLVRETDTKNKFIAALLRVQDRKHASVTSSLSSASVEERASDERLDEDKRSRSHSRRLSQSFSHTLSKGLSQSLAWAKSKRSSNNDRPNNDMYLNVVIPYNTSSNPSHVYSIQLLKQWITLLNAMVERNPNLPNLISSYLQSQGIINNNEVT
jgi:hypothetical protein